MICPFESSKVKLLPDILSPSLNIEYPIAYNQHNKSGQRCQKKQPSATARQSQHACFLPSLLRLSYSIPPGFREIRLHVRPRMREQPQPDLKNSFVRTRIYKSLKSPDSANPKR